DGPVSTGCQTVVAVAYAPYVSVTGGDVMTGSGFGQACSDNTSGGIFAWNQDSTAGAFAGAGTQFAAGALGLIDGFASGQTSASGGSGVGLSLSNTVHNSTGSGAFGGNFGSIPCATD